MHEVGKLSKFNSSLGWDNPSGANHHLSHSTLRGSSQLLYQLKHSVLNGYRDIWSSDKSAWVQMAASPLSLCGSEWAGLLVKARGAEAGATGHSVPLKVHLHSHRITCCQSKETLATALLSKPKSSGYRVTSCLFPLKERTPPGKGIPNQQWQNILPPFKAFCHPQRLVYLQGLAAFSFLGHQLGLVDGTYPTISVPRLSRSLLPKCFIKLVPLPLRPRNKPFAASRFHNLVKHILDLFLKKEKQNQKTTSL